MKYTGLITLLATLLFTATPANAHQPRGTVMEGLTVTSKILKRPVRYSIYLPYDYQTSNRLYPTVYLLHGYSDNDTGWLQFGEAHLLADKAILDNTIPPMILVMPDGGVSWYINNHDGSNRYEDFFFNEFIPHIESSYRIRKERQYRGIAGLSMGGYGAIVYSLRHPDMFTAFAAFSPAIWTDEEISHMESDRWRHYFHASFGPGDGKARITGHLQSYNPLHLIRNAKPTTAGNPRMYIDCGDDDFLYKGNAAFHTLLRDLNIAHEYRVRDGGHQWSYWRSGLIDGLRFIGADFHRP